MARFTAKRNSRLRGTANGTELSRKANAAGFKKRRAQSSKSIANAAQDVYDYQPVKNRRGNIPLMLDEDENRGARYDDDDALDEEDVRSRRRPRLVGESEDDERIDSDEDEEIDSDVAFDESDENEFAGSNFRKKASTRSKKATRKKARGSVRFAEVDLEEDEDDATEDMVSQIAEDETGEEEEEGEDGEFIDVLDILDGRAEPYLGDEEDIPELNAKQSRMSRGDSTEAKNKSKQEEEAEEDEEEEETEEEVGGDDDARISASDEEEEDTTALEALNNFVSALETGPKRKASHIDETVESGEMSQQAKKRKRLLKDRTEAGAENEFSASVAGSSKLSLDDLLTPLASKQSTLSSLKKSVKPIAELSKNQPLPAPLPTRTQERLDREAAYEQTKQEVDKWTDTMKRIQEAEHLSFPLQAPRSVKVSNLELAAKFKPTTEMESSIDRLLRSAKLREEDINKTEDLMMKDLSIEEVAARRAKLRKMRELTFRADVKAKRIAKIKSKTYRRIHKKERAKLMAKLDASGGQEVDEEEDRLKAEAERARERATLRHKNTGKWAKAMKAREELDTDQRRDINEMLERGERLRRRIQGKGSDEEDDAETSDEDEGMEGGDSVMRLKANAFEELQKLQEEGAEEDESGDGKQKAKSVSQMKFMKDAAARRNAALDREIDDFRREMGDLAEGSDKDGTGGSDTDVPRPTERVHGRMVFRPSFQAQSSTLLPPPLSAMSDTSTLRSHDSVAHSPVLTIRYDPAESTPPPSSSTIAETPSTEPLNPWLVESPSSIKVIRRKNELVVGKNITQAQRSEAVMQKQLKKGANDRELERNDATVEITTEDVLLLESSEKAGDSSTPTVSGPAKERKKKDKKKKDKNGKGRERAEQPQEEGDTDANSEVEGQEAALRKGKKVTAFEQRELVARAFAGDNVVREFADEKHREIEADAPRELDMTLKGWGSWGGAGIKTGAPKPHLIKKVAGIDPKSRTDYGKAHVIISERQDRKALKFAVKDLPYPYTSKAQFEARMSTPLGVEWNTRLGFQRATLPRVVKKMGTIIDPLEKV